ncbi:uncharacterized protein LOC108911266 [Anoplophora glabripennis]|uniref:uncharacterized protein LOC108911266 n=1 Tax=Anoplophora glabripennis TaxID=217634 RepID=UPI0008745420|nr:uncharacterized protein LOC108911266 [Anoplophora glabripennis]
MQKIVLLCFAILHTASALECFTCPYVACTRTDRIYWVKMTCAKFPGYAEPNIQPVCIKYVFKDQTLQTTEVHRQCDFAEIKNGKPTINCKMFGDETECHMCLTDLCNSAKSISFSFIALWGVALAIAAPKLL